MPIVMENMTRTIPGSYRLAILPLLFLMLMTGVGVIAQNDHNHTSRSFIEFNEAEMRRQLAQQEFETWQIEEKVRMERLKLMSKIRYDAPKSNDPSLDYASYQKNSNDQKILGDCDNVDFEYGNFTNWESFYANASGVGAASLTGGNVGCRTFNNPPLWNFQIQSGVLPNRHQLVSPGVYDSCAPTLPVVPQGGGNFAVKLGNRGVSLQSEEFRYTFTVSAAKPYFVYRYAMVLQHPGHTPANSAYFETKIYRTTDTTCSQPIPCSYQHIYAGQAGIPWKNVTSTDPYCSQHRFGGGNCVAQYTDWQVKVVDLTAYVGQTLVAYFTNSDCAESGHWGYTYIDPFCTDDPIPHIPITSCTAPVSISAPTAHNQVGTVIPPGTGFPPPTEYNQTGVTYSWAPGGQTTQTINVTTSGSYTATTTLNQTSGIWQGVCTQRVIYDVVITNPPVPDFTYTSSNCGLTYNFTDASTPAGSITGWTWNFGETSSGAANTSTNQNPTHTYAGTGTYTVALVVALGAGCVDSVKKTIVINPPVTANFTANPLCLGGATNFTNSSTGTPSGYQWNFGEPGSGAANTSTQTNPSHTYAAAGTYTVTLIAEGPAGCNDTVQIPITVDPVPVASFTSTAVCEGNPTPFNSTSTIAAPGTIASYSWGFGDSQSGTGQSPTHTYATSGTFTTTLLVTSTNGCTHTVQNQITVNPGAVANFTANPLCLGSTTNFTNTSTGAITSYEWNFGEPSSGAANTSTQPNPSHAYAAPGTYSVTLITLNPGGCDDTITIPITVDPLPVAAFTQDQVCEGNITTFTDGSSINPGTLSNWEWDFGDTQTSTSQNPTHSYPAQGTYTATLIVTSSNGCKDTIQNTVIVDPAPAADFTSNTVCLGAPTTFSDASQGSPSSWSWNFGEPASGTNNTATSQNPSHTYLSAGTYTVQLIVNTNGCIDTVEHPVVIGPAANADFTAPPVCLTNATVFTDASSTSQGTVLNWLWNFGEPSSANNTSTSQNPTHTYGTAGTYTVILGITTDQGCIDTVQKTVIVNPLPTANFTAPIVCVGSAMQFTDASLPPAPSTITNWSWNFGDGNIGNTQNPSHTYATAGTFNVLLTITNSEGCQQNVTLPVNVSPLPVAAFGPSSVCLNTPTQFTDNSTGTLSGWDWDFDDGSPHATTQNPMHTYTAAGIYNVTLVIAAGTCMDTVTAPVTVFELPVTDFNGTNVCLNQPTVFTDNSSVPNGGTVSTYSWSFGDGNTSTQQHPTHTYTTSGTYSATLVTTSDNGCTDTLTKTVIVHPLPVADFSVNSVCEGTANNFTDASQGSPSSWSWNFGEPASASNTSTQQNPSHTYDTAGTYTTTLIVQTSFGCADTATNPVTVSPIPVVAFTVNDTDGCVPLCVSFKDLTVATGDPIATWTWTMGDGGGSVQQHPSYCYKTVGDFDVSLTVTTVNGCSASFTELDYIHVYPYPIADFVATPETASYLDPHFVFTDLSSGANNWSWNFGDNSLWTSSTGSTEYTYEVDNTGIITFDVTLVVMNQYGCADTIVKPVEIEPEWTFYVPNTFTPNADGHNDGFIGKGIGILEYEMWIYDRWGNEIYHCTDMNSPWDGKVQNGPSGEIAQIDTYVWLIMIKDIFEKRHRYIGHVNIVK